MGRVVRRSGHPKVAFVLGLASLLLGLLGPVAIFAGWRAWRISRAADAEVTQWGVALLGLGMGCLSTAILLMGVIRFLLIAVR